jgi:hypothetical protein
VLPGYFEERIADEKLAEAQARYPMVRSKEELHYFRLFIGHFGSPHGLDGVGQWVCL